MDNLTMLRRERNSLLSEWVNANKADKVKLLVKIMDIDEQLGIDVVKPKRRKQIV